MKKKLCFFKYFNFFGNKLSKRRLNLKFDAGLFLFYALTPSDHSKCHKFSICMLSKISNILDNSMLNWSNFSFCPVIWIFWQWIITKRRIFKKNLVLIIFDFMSWPLRPPKWGFLPSKISFSLCNHVKLASIKLMWNISRVKH